MSQEQGQDEYVQVDGTTTHIANNEAVAYGEIRVLSSTCCMISKYFWLVRKQVLKNLAELLR